MKVQAESFHLNGHIIGFRPQTQKLESPYKTPSNILAVKALKLMSLYDNKRLKTQISTTYQLNIGNGFFRSHRIFLNCTQQIESKYKNLYWSTELNTVEKLRS